MIKAIIFDIDGTLIDSNHLHAIAWQRAFKQAGYSFERSQIAPLIGMGGDHVVPKLLGKAASRADEEEQQRIRDWYAEAFDELRVQGEPFADAEAILRDLKQRGLRVAFASSAKKQHVAHFAAKLNADKYVEVITNGDDVKRSKPAPDIFNVALERLGLTADEAMAVGDTPYDIIAARGAGLACVAVRSGGFSDELLQAEQPVAIYNDVASLRQQLDLLVAGFK